MPPWQRSPLYSKWLLRNLLFGVLQWGWILEPRSEKGGGKLIFFKFKTGSGFTDTGGTLPPKESVVGYWWNLLILPHNLIRNHDTVELCLIRSSMSRKKLNVLTGDRIGGFLNKKIYGCFCWRGQKEIEKKRVSVSNKYQNYELRH